MTFIAASLWSVENGRAAEEADRLRRGGVQRFHWDHADGTMSPRGGFGPSEALRIGKEAQAEAHLMHHDPRPHIADWARFCDAVAVHVNQPHWRESLEMIRGYGALPIAVINDADELQQVDALTSHGSLGVLVMAVRPGHAGTTFDERSVDLVKAASSRSFTRIGVDGSVTADRAAMLIQAGANWIVSGTSLTSAPDVSDWLEAARAK